MSKNQEPGAGIVHFKTALGEGSCEIYEYEVVDIVANMASYAIGSSLIFVINDNKINRTNQIVEHISVGIPRSHGY
jgi:hypothetical protein